MLIWAFCIQYQILKIFRLFLSYFYKFVFFVFVWFFVLFVPKTLVQCCQIFIRVTYIFDYLTYLIRFILYIPLNISKLTKASGFHRQLQTAKYVPTIMTLVRREKNNMLLKRMTKIVKMIDVINNTRNISTHTSGKFPKLIF